MTAPQPRPGILDIIAYVPGKGADPGAGQVFKLSANENPLGASPRAREACRAAAAAIHLYPDGAAINLRASIATAHRLDPARIVCGAGSDELIQLLAKSYAGPGDEVLYSQYGFNIYPIVAQAAGATPIAAPERDLCCDVDAMLAAVTPRTRLVFLANPNNPTGSCLPVSEVKRLLAGLDPGVLLVLDAAYAEYVQRNDYSAGEELVAAHNNVVMTRTFSKIYGLAALRLGWAYCPAAIADALNRVRGPFNISSLAMAAGIAALEDRAFLDLSCAHNAMWLPWLSQALTGLGLKVAPSAGNFLLVEFPQTPAHNAAAAFQYLRARGVILREMDSYGLPACLRVTIGSDEAMRATVAGVSEFLS